MFRVRAGAEVIIDLTGKRFGRLVVVKYIRSDKWYNKFWLCKCDCGEETSVQGGNLKTGHTKSCGCVNVTHGHAKAGKTSKTYAVWQSMIQRCVNPNNTRYHDYGGRGIKVCESWMTFENFLEDMGEAPEGQQIDRINNSKSYCKSNCRWATRNEQQRNTRRNHLVTFNNKTQCISAWAEEFNISYNTLYARIVTYNWSVKRALTTPVKKKGE